MDDVGRKLAVLEERMNTMQAQYEGALDRLRADLARHGEELARRDARQGEVLAKQIEELARRDVETARQATRMTNSLLIAIGVATAVLGVVIALT